MLRADEVFVWALLGAVGGLFLFYRGFRILQRKRLILNTPTSKIRSAALGLVEVSGLAVGPYSIKAPITGKDCYLYRTIAWELRKSGKNEQWKKVADERLHVPFYLDDNTGLALVDPQGAETDLHRDFREEYSASFFAADDMPQTVRMFLLRYGVSGEHRVRVEEYCVKPKNALFVLGTLAENPGVEVSPRPIRTQIATFALNSPGLSTEGAGSGSACVSPLTNVVTTNAQQEIINLSSSQRPHTAAEMTQQGKIAAALLKAGINNAAAWSAAGIEDPAAAMAMASRLDVSPSPTGTAVASPSPAREEFDLHPTTVLAKGKNNPVFFISWRSQREVVASLAWKTVACVWGGPALTMVATYVLLARLGLV